MTAEVPMSDARDLKGETGFAVTAVPFPVHSKKSLLRLQGIRAKKPRVSMVCASGVGRFGENSLYFPGYQGI